MLDLIDDDILMDSSEDEDYSDDVSKIDIYRTNIRQNPADYDSHFRLIKALRYSKNYTGAREAREKMNEYYPLSPELWLEWINDEKSINSDRDAINNLFIRAKYDYKSVDVWFEYCQFVIGYIQDKKEIQQIFEMACSEVGTNIQSGYLIWGTYILYENSILLTCGNKSDKEINEQKERVYKLYLRQLSLPLIGNDDTFKEFVEWNQGDEKRIEEVQLKYEGSKKLLEIYKIYEDKIINATIDYSANKTKEDSTSKEEEWLTYLQYAEDSWSKCEILNIYERAITELCLSQNIWAKYLTYLRKHFEMDHERILKAYKRAVQNYKSSLELWLGLVRYMEKFDCPVEEIRKSFDLLFRETLIDINPFLPLWFSYFDFEKRLLDKHLKVLEKDESDLDLEKIRGHFEKLVSIENYMEYDPQCSLIKYWAFIEAKYARNLIKARELWNLIMKSVGNNLSSLWLENLDFERKFGNFDHVKRIASNAINCSTDYPEYLFEKILRIIAEDGDLSSYLHFVKKIDLQKKKINERRLIEKKSNKQETLPNRNIRKAPHTNSPQKQAKKPKLSNDPVKQSQETNEEKLKQDPVEQCNEKTIFVSNLDYGVDENNLRELFEKCGIVVDIRIAKDALGKSRGFAYIQYENEIHVVEALRLEHEKLKGRPMYVNRCNPTERHSFKFAIGVTEKCKLFIKNLPKTVTKYALENIFRSYGTLKEVRLVTFKSGVPKGIAYVEFENEDDASKAIVGTDGMSIGENVIEVCLSKPPPKIMPDKEKVVDETVDQKSTNSFIVPRSVHRPTTTQKKLIHGVSAKEEDIDLNTVKKTNSDFRKFLL